MSALTPRGGRSTSGPLDLRGFDMSALDLRDRLLDLLWADFSTSSTWPTAAKLPREFDWKRILDLGKNPGLGLRLRAAGITGRDVSIAMIDQRLLVEHQEYADRLQLYEEIGAEGEAASMHGPACASLAVGRTVGVAPGAKLFYIAVSLRGKQAQGASPISRDFTACAKAVRRIVEINGMLPDKQKIRVLSLSVGWRPAEVASQEMTAATNAARDAGMLVVSSSIDRTHGFRFHGLGRAPLADPDQFESYEPGAFWIKAYKPSDGSALMIPMDSRTVAGPGAADSYSFDRTGGWSWSIPYIAGLYALCAQVRPTITPGQFWDLAMKTGRMIEVTRDGKTYRLGPVVDPARLIEAVRKIS
jgi:subtilisin family serine protease